MFLIANFTWPFGVRATTYARPDRLIGIVSHRRGRLRPGYRQSAWPGGAARGASGTPRGADAGLPVAARLQEEL